MSHTILPAIILALSGTWPPARNGRPAGVSEVGAFSYEREIVGSTLPGNVRARTGLSVGSGSATVAQEPDAGLTPWAQDPGKRVAAGVLATLYAETPTGSEPMGSWVTAETSGSPLSPEVSVALLERQSPGKRGAHTVAHGQSTDPGALAADLARQCGFLSVPPPAAGALAALPISYGVDIPDAGAIIPDLAIPAWGTASGALGASGVRAHFPNAPSLPPTFCVTLNASTDTIGWVEFLFTTFVANGGYVRISPWSRQIEVKLGGSAVSSGTWAGSPDAVWSKRVQVEISVNRAGDGMMNFLGARARTGPGAPWSAQVTATGSSYDVAVFSILSNQVSISGIQLTTSADAPGLYSAPMASIVPLAEPGVTVSRWMPHDLSPWDALQALVGANLAAAWVTRAGTLVCRDRNYLAGQSPSIETVDLATRAEDLPWSIDPADVADRLEVTYSPGGAVANPGVASNVFTLGEVISIPAGGTVEILVPLEGPCVPIESWDHAAFVPPGSAVASWPKSIYSTMTAPSGGSPINVMLTEIRVIRVNSGAVTIRVTNRHSSTAWLVDAAGQPCLILQALDAIRYDTPASITRGELSEAAANSATVELAHWVQSASAAESVADYTWGRLSSPAWKAGSVRVVPSWTTDLGQIVQLQHPASSLDVRALVTKVVVSGQPGEVTQLLDLVLLPPTWADFDAAWAGKTWTAFDALWAGQQWPAFDLNPTRS